MTTPYSDKIHCCGCTACMTVCSFGAIAMKSDDEGFEYPIIDSDKCTNCGKCAKVCTFVTPNKNNNRKQEIYAGYLTDINERMKSQSGGAFYAFATQTILKGGCVYGAAIEGGVKHIRASDSLRLDRLRGSKYTQSSIGDCFSFVKNDLILGKQVVFSGTPCQVDGLLSFLGKQFDNLLTIDLICHGVPSPLIFRKYCEWLEKQAGSPIENFNFRDKAINGWADHIETFRFRYGHQKRKVSIGKFPTARRQFVNLFYSNLCLRPCCGVCPYTSFDRVADITVADFWGVEKAFPKLDTERGVSLVMVNTEKGKKYLKDIPQSDFWRAKSNSQACTQANLLAPSVIPENRADFWEMYREKGADYIFDVMFPYKKYLRSTWWFKILRKIKHILKGRLK